LKIIHGIRDVIPTIELASIFM